MVITATMTTKEQVIGKAGSAVNSDLITATANSELLVELWIIEAESLVNVITKTDFTTLYSGLDESVKRLLQAAVSDLAASYCVAHDMVAYGSRTEAEDLVNLLETKGLRAIGILRENQSSEVVKSGADA